ncbi:MAG: cell envelope integrity protein TolA [Pseudomonadota bacterium]
MREWLDKALAITGTLLLHAGLIALLFSNVRWQTPAPQRAATTIKAAVVDDAAFAIADAELAEITQQTPPSDEPPTPDEPAVDPQEAIEAAAAEQRRIDAAREREAAEQAQRQREAQAEAERQQKLADEQAAREREAQLARDKEAAAEREREQAAERKRQEEAERKREEEEAQRKREEEAERKRKEEAERKRQEEAERKAAAERRARERQAELDAQLRDAMLAEEAREGAVNAGLLAQYVELIRQDVERQWSRPVGVPDGIRCEVRVRQLRSGEVISVQVVDCAGGEVLIRSIEQAVYKASPLPLPGDASLFDPNLRFPFKTGE